MAHQAIPPSQTDQPVNTDQEQRRSGEHTKDSHIHSHVTKMLLTVSAIFISTLVPSLIARVISVSYLRVLGQDVHF